LAPALGTASVRARGTALARARGTALARARGTVSAQAAGAISARGRGKTSGRDASVISARARGTASGQDASASSVPTVGSAAAAVAVGSGVAAAGVRGRGGGEVSRRGAPCRRPRGRGATPAQAAKRATRWSGDGSGAGGCIFGSAAYAERDGARRQQRRQLGRWPAGRANLMAYPRPFAFRRPPRKRESFDTLTGLRTPVFLT